MSKKNDRKQKLRRVGSQLWVHNEVHQVVEAMIAAIEQRYSTIQKADFVRDIIKAGLPTVIAKWGPATFEDVDFTILEPAPEKSE